MVYSFKVLAHVEDIETALAEMARVTRPGGYVLAEFYNPRSLRYLVKSLKPPTAISRATNDEAVYTRYDAWPSIRATCPRISERETSRGVRIVTPVARRPQCARSGAAFRAAENRLADAPCAATLVAFVIADSPRVANPATLGPWDEF